MKFTGRITQSERSWAGGEVRLYSGLSPEGWSIWEDELGGVRLAGPGWPGGVAVQVQVAVPKDRGICMDGDGYPITRPPSVEQMVEVADEVIRAAVSQLLAELDACAASPGAVDCSGQFVTIRAEARVFRFGDPREGYGLFAWEGEKPVGNFWQVRSAQTPSGIATQIRLGGEALA